MTEEVCTKDTRKIIPEFVSEEAESEFWLSVDTTEYFSNATEVFQSPKKMPISLKVDTRLMMFIKRLAKDKGVSYQNLMLRWLWERAREEVHRI